MKRVVIVGIVLGLGACSSTQVAEVQAACSAAQAAAAIATGTLKGGANDTATAIAGYVDAGCKDAEAISALATDPSSLEWLGIQEGTLKALTSAS